MAILSTWMSVKESAGMYLCQPEDDIGMVFLTMIAAWGRAY